MSLVSMAILALLAQAGDPSVDPDPKARAQVLLREGAQAYESGAFAEALEKFGQAYSVFPSPKLLFNIGQANRELGRPADAVDAFERFLIQAADASPDLLTEARQSVDELSPKIGKLFINCNVSGAEIAVDGRIVGRSPLVEFVRVGPGSHQITATHPVTIPVVQPVVVVAGTAQTIAIRMQAAAQPAVAPTVLSPPLPPAPRPYSPPAIDLRTPRPQPQAPADRGWWLGRRWTWVAAGATVLFLGGASIAGLAMQSKYEELRTSCGKAGGANAAGCKSGEISALDARRNTANLFWGLSAAAAVTTGVLFFVEGHRVSVSPMAGEVSGLIASVRY